MSKDKNQSDLFMAQVMAQSAYYGHNIMEETPEGKANMDKIFNKDLLTELVNYNPMELIYLGIDPGKNGGIIALLNNEIIGKWIIPLIGDKVDLNALYLIFNTLKSKYRITVILEEVHSVYGSSAESNWVFGFVCGAIEAIVISNGLRLNKIQPKEWQAEIWQNGDKVYKPKKPDQKKASIDTKGTSLNAAKRLFPGFDFRKSDSKQVKNDHDGLIDAALLAEMGRRKNL